jgi:hypothetical protein
MVKKKTHDSCIGGHARIQNSYMRFQVVFYWPLMKKIMKQMVKESDVYK